MAVNVFVIEPMRNCVEGVTGEVRLDVALTISPRECHLAVLHHGQGCARTFQSAIALIAVDRARE